MFSFDQPLTTRSPHQLRVRDIKPYLSPGQESYGKIRLEWTQCNYGGMRPWLCCPRCDRRSGILYQQRQVLACRKCWGMVHPSTRENAQGRWLRKCEWFHRRTGQRIPAGFPVRYPPKPWGMRHKTYADIVSTMQLEESTYLSHILKGINRQYQILDGLLSARALSTAPE